MKKLTNKQVIELVKNNIEVVAFAFGIPQSEVTYGQFMKYNGEGEDGDGELVLPTNLIEKQCMIKRAGGFKNIKETYFPPEISEESIEFASSAKINRAEAKVKAVEGVFLSRFEEVCQKIFAKPVVVTPGRIVKPKGDAERHFHLLISDLHIGAHLKPEEGNLSYNVIEPSRRMASIAQQTAQYKPQYRGNTKLWINLVGDIIHGRIHEAGSAQRLAEQKALSLWILVHFVTYLSSHFNDIEINCVSGNHDRFVDKNPERVASEKWDSHATDIYFALKMAVRNIKNVKINIPKTPWIIYNSLGNNLFGTHADNIIKISNPSSTVNVKFLENQVNKINASLNSEDKHGVIFLAHVHKGMILRLDNGVTIISNPALIPPDPYANSIGTLEGVTGQYIFESVKGHPFGDSRFLEVNQKTDKDASLDTIIKPFLGF